MNTEGKAGITGGGFVVAFAWLWNEFVPGHKVPAEVAAAIVPMVGYFIAWVVEKTAGRKP